jgi:pyruvate ferredoxin oxidoreductase gamma subunit
MILSVILMIEIRFHGRGGQGAVTSATVLAKAAGIEGKHAQAFPAFGPERRGAPVRAFCRIDEKPITIRSQVYSPDYVVVLDPALLQFQEVSDGLKDRSEVVINSGDAEAAGRKTHRYDASKKATEILGREIVSTAMLAVFAKATGAVRLESLLKALEDMFSGKVLELNKELVTKVYEEAENGREA